MTGRMALPSTGGPEYETRRSVPWRPVRSARCSRRRGEGERTFAITADVKEAHRQIPVSREDWRLLGCRVRPGTYVYKNTVGTFGISPASYCWSRIGSGIGRLMQYVVGQSAATWVMLVADGYHCETMFFLLLNSVHNYLHQGNEFHVNSNWTCLFLNMTSDMSLMECELCGNFLLMWPRRSVGLSSCFFDDHILSV